MFVRFALALLVATFWWIAIYVDLSLSGTSLTWTVCLLFVAAGLVGWLLLSAMRKGFGVAMAAITAAIYTAVFASVGVSIMESLGVRLGVWDDPSARMAATVMRSLFVPSASIVAALTAAVGSLLKT